MADDKPEVDNSVRFLWLEREVVPKIVEVLGKDGEEFRCEIKAPTDGFFISSIYMLDLIPRYESGDERHRLVIKVQPEDGNARSFLNTDVLFHNEILFYQRLGRNYVNYPKCVYAIPEPIDKAMIVLENVTQFGYKSVTSGELLGTRHALAAVREIGRFHAQGYVLKEKNPGEFFGAVKELRTIYEDKVHPISVEFYNTVSLRPVNYLRSVNYDPHFCDKISTCLADAFDRILTDCLKPRNELAVLCHGDFTANNALMKEEDDGGLKAILIDFAQLRYASPATDVSTFIYVSCKDEVRRGFSDVYKAYHDAMMGYLEEQGIQDLERYSLDMFLEDYKRHAIAGCIIAICFAPIFSLGNAFADYGDLVENKSKYFEILMNFGGDELSKRQADMLVEFRDNGWLEHLI